MALWTPTDDASLIGAWRMHDATTGTGGISSVANLKGGGAALAQGTSGDRPDVGTALNGLNSADFVSANTDYLVASPVTFSGAPVMLVFVAQLDAGAPNTCRLFELYGTKTGRAFPDSAYDTTGKGIRLVHDASADNNNTVRQLTAGSPFIYVGVINASELRAFLNGETTGAAQSHSSTPDFSSFGIGNRTALDRSWDGPMWFAGITSDITDANQRKWEGWAAHTFALTGNLPSGHAYKSAAPIISVTHDVSAAIRQAQALLAPATVLREAGFRGLQAQMVKGDTSALLATAFSAKQSQSGQAPATALRAVSAGFAQAQQVAAAATALHAVLVRSVQAQTLKLVEFVQGEVIRLAAETRRIVLRAPSELIVLGAELRRIVLGAEVRRITLGAPGMADTGSWAKKDPQEAKFYSIDWTDPLDGDTISTVTWTPATGITAANQSVSGAVTTAKLSGGVDGTDYEITVTITTAGGQTFERSPKLKVRTL